MLRTKALWTATVKFLECSRSAPQKFATSENSELTHKHNTQQNGKLRKWIKISFARTRRDSAGKLVTPSIASEVSVRRIAEENLRCESHVTEARWLLSQAAKAKKVIRCNFLARSLKRKVACRPMLFSGEIISIVVVRVNLGNPTTFPLQLGSSF